MQTLQIQLPDLISINQQEIKMLLASKLYENGLLSIGQAAETHSTSYNNFNKR